MPIRVNEAFSDQKHRQLTLGTRYFYFLSYITAIKSQARVFEY